jgi:peptidoglycan/LPS O-acetylase OafA/YrhL
MTLEWILTRAGAFIGTIAVELAFRRLGLSTTLSEFRKHTIRSLCKEFVFLCLKVFVAGVSQQAVSVLFPNITPISALLGAVVVVLFLAKGKRNRKSARKKRNKKLHRK